MMLAYKLQGPEMKMVMVTPYKLFEPRNSELTYSVVVRKT
jgi:hypothetical protein